MQKNRNIVKPTNPNINRRANKEISFLVAPRLKLTTFDVEDLGELCGHIARIYETHRGEKGIVYFKTIQECLDARSILVSLGIDCESVTSLMGSDRRDQIRICQIRRDQIRRDQIREH